MTEPRRRILIVDDEKMMVKTLSDILRLRGWEVVGANAGEEALEYLGTASPVDIVLMDVRMGGMTGVDALRIIRERQPGLPVILMTAFSTTELLAEAERQGAVRILAKPLAIHGLFQLLESITQDPRRVLVVDDNRAYLATLSDILQSNGYIVLRADTLATALGLLRDRNPDVVLLDMRLDSIDPEMSILAIREVNPSVALILYSGSETMLQQTEGRLNGDVLATLRKPFPPDTLLKLLEGAFHG